MYFAYLDDQYQQPKWKAQVPHSAALQINDNLRVRNLWELKEALHALEEGFIGEWLVDRHHLADWIRESIGHEILAARLEREVAKWKLLVHLEQEMMRTLHLPEYVAKRWLDRANDPFRLSDGREIWYVKELPELFAESPVSVKVHIEGEPGDFANWSQDSLGNYVLAELLAKATDPDDVLEDLMAHIADLEDAVAD